MSPHASQPAPPSTGKSPPLDDTHSLAGADNADATQSSDSPPSSAVELPKTVGRYRVEKLLGEGSYGRVFLAHDDDLKRRVAIKVPRAERVAAPEDAEAYVAEARVLAALDHRHVGTSFLGFAESLHAMGAWDSIQGGSVALSKNGNTFDIECESFALSEARSMQWKTRTAPPPLFSRHSEQAFWTQWLPESNTYYFKYNRCEDAEGFARLVEATKKELAEQEVERFVLDLRDNAGGDSRVFAPLLRVLQAKDELRAEGRLFVILGRRTFSSGWHNALELKRSIPSVVFVGEPAGARANYFGHVHFSHLPNSKLRFGYATKHYTFNDKADSDTLEPEMSVEADFEDWLAGRDPVLNAILKQE